MADLKLRFLIAYFAICISFLPPICVTSYVTRSEALVLREKAREMFIHAYDNYMQHAYPADELKPLSCTGRWRTPPGDKDNRGTLDDSLGGFSLTLIDALDTLAVMGNYSEFERAVNHVINDVSFDNDVTVSVFETTIRVLGGLLSGHVLAERFLNHSYPPHRSLLGMAVDLGDRLLPAFNTPTRIPFSRVNLRYGVPHGEPSLTCLAGAGTLLMEFGVLSRLSGNPIYEKVADDTVRALWERRSRVTDLPGGLIDVRIGQYVGDLTTGIGAGSDSFYEYLLKSYILFGDPEYLDMFNKSYDAIKRYMKQGNWYLDVHMHTGSVMDHKITSLQAFWPALQVLSGDIDSAIEMHSTFYGLWRRYGFLPEYFNVKRKSVVKGLYTGYPLRPEFAESTFLLYRATRDNHYLEVGKHVMKNLQNTRVSCGFAAVADVETMRLEDRMDSFFLSETCKYLYLLFDEDNEFANSLDFLFSTEGHILPIYPPKPSNRTQDEIQQQQHAPTTKETTTTTKSTQNKEVKKKDTKGGKPQQVTPPPQQPQPPRRPPPKCDWTPCSIFDQFKGICSLNERQAIWQDISMALPYDSDALAGPNHFAQQQMLLSQIPTGNVFTVNAWGQSVTLVSPFATSTLVSYIHLLKPKTHPALHDTDEVTKTSSQQPQQQLVEGSPEEGGGSASGIHSEKELMGLKKWRLKTIARKLLKQEGKLMKELSEFKTHEQLVAYILKAQQQWLEKKKAAAASESASVATKAGEGGEGGESGGVKEEDERMKKMATFKVSLAQFGPGLVNTLGGEEVEVVDLPRRMCTKEELQSIDRERVKGRVVLVDRGDCSFVEKVLITTMLGVKGVLIADNSEGPLFSMTGVLPEEGMVAPAALITYKDAADLRHFLADSPDETLSLFIEPATFLESDDIPPAGSVPTMGAGGPFGVEVLSLIQNFFKQEFGCMGGDCAKHMQKDTVFLLHGGSPPQQQEHEATECMAAATEQKDTA